MELIANLQQYNKYPAAINAIEDFTLCIEACRVPNWCSNTNFQPYHLAVCMTMSLFNFQKTLAEKAEQSAKIGKVEKANEYYFFMNKVTNMVNYLFLVYLQVYLNTKDAVNCKSTQVNDLISNYYTQAELDAFNKELRCVGFDLNCIFDCLKNFTLTCSNESKQC